MIHINFDEPQTNAWRNWRRRCEEEREKLVRAVENGEKPNFDSRLYKGMKAGVYFKPDGPFHGKCAYCEQAIAKPHSQPGDVEHFRPKASVTNDDGTPVDVPSSGGAREHPGYYWLAYDWRNLLPACNGCNRRQTDPSSGVLIGKGTLFPVRGFRAVRPGDEAREEPLLLHPVCDDPANHMEMDSTGVLHWGQSDRGEATARILGLNLRGLPEARKRVYDDTRMRMGVLAQELARTGGDVSPETSCLLSELKQAKEGHYDHAMASRKAIKDAKEKWRVFQAL